MLASQESYAEAPGVSTVPSVSASTVALVVGIGTIAVALVGHWISHKAMAEQRRSFQREFRETRRKQRVEEARTTRDRHASERRYVQERAQADLQWRTEMQSETQMRQEEMSHSDKLWHRERALDLLNMAIDRACSSHDIERPVGLAQLEALVASHMVQIEDISYIEAVALSILPPAVVQEAAKRRADSIIREDLPSPGSAPEDQA
jgi:uncharacterized protein HemX